ncbi:MAG: PhnD/SsuA/transferrin family substrate-binding protein [Zavarzinella sp.]
MFRRTFLLLLSICAVPAVAQEPLTLIVMDPLALPLSCPCVKGYAQRDYEQLAKYLSDKTKRPVVVHFSESLADAVNQKSKGKADIVIGKDSVIKSEASVLKRSLQPVASLTGKDGKTTMTGLLVVHHLDMAVSPSDLNGYHLIFGPKECDEKNAAVRTLLKSSGVKITSEPDIAIACDAGAYKVIDAFQQGKKAATAISSYAHPLLEGCGKIKKGDLRVIGETAPVPFVTAFVSGELSTELSDTITQALLDVKSNAKLCTAIETKHGFQPITKKK